MSAIGSIPWMAKRNPADTGKKVAIHSRVDPELLEWLEGVAREQERSVSFLVERAIRLMREAGSSAPRPERKRG